MARKERRKTCVTCHEEKWIREFYRDKRNKDGRRYDCKDCFNTKKAKTMATKWLGIEFKEANDG